ncbi:MAG: hypothetical protein RSE94_01990 [Pseudomonas sp.]
MFSYTDDAIVTSSPTGRHLSTVIRRPAAIGPLDWAEHADQVCKVLNELDGKAKANSLSLHLQTVGRVERGTTYEEYCCNEGLDPGPLAEPRSSGPLASALASTRIAELEKHLDDATTKLAAAQMLLEKPIEVTADLGASLFYLPVGGTTTHNNRTFKRVE